MFLTWSAADNHWIELHRLFPNHEEYLGKKVVKLMSDIPPGQDESQYILKKKDILLRMKNVAENSDIVNWFFRKNIQLLVEHVFPILKITHYIARSEFQGRGSIHIHAILAADGNVTPTDLENVIKSAQPPNEPCEIQIHEEAKQRVCDFAMNHIGLTTLHPNPDPMQ